jgi:hypothetical protein
MKPDLMQMAKRTIERFVVVLIVAPALRFLFTGSFLVPWATVVCVMAAVVLYDVWRFAVDLARYDAPEDTSDKSGRAGWPAVAVLALVGCVWIGCASRQPEYTPPPELLAQIDNLIARHG